MEMVAIPEMVRALMAVGAFSVGAYYDWKTGMISEKLWLVFGLAAVPVYIADPPSYGTVWIMGLGALAAFACWMTRLYGTGDFEALLALSFVLPVFNGVPVMVPALSGGAFLSMLAVLVANPVMNMRGGMKSLFSDLRDSAPRKFLAFFLVHKYRLGEIHAYCGERNSRGRRTLWLSSARYPRHVDEIPIEAGTYVGITIPLLVPMAVSLITALVLLSLYNMWGA